MCYKRVSSRYISAVGRICPPFFFFQQPSGIVKSIVYMQDVNGIQSSKWCGGCHDPAILLNGIMDRPINENLHTPAAQAGLACTACHSIERVKDTMGNSGYVIKYPPLHDIASSNNRFIRSLHNYLIRLDPEPHRKSFLKPFHRDNTAEFCSTCHKVHLDFSGQ